MNTEQVEIETADGVADGYFVRPDEGVCPGVLFCMDAVGLRPAIQAMADRLARHGYAVLAPNLFYRLGRAPLLELPKVVNLHQMPDLLASVRTMISSLTPEFEVRDAGAYLEFMAARKDVKPGRVGAVGYCMGGPFAVRAAAACSDRVAAAASFHAGNLATDAADSPHFLLPMIDAELYFGHAELDQAMPPEQVARLGEALRAAGLVHESEVYPGAAHGWAVPDLEVYDEAGSERHWDALLAFLDRTLKT